MKNIYKLVHGSEYLLDYKLIDPNENVIYFFWMSIFLKKREVVFRFERDKFSDFFNEWENIKNQFLKQLHPNDAQKEEKLKEFQKEVEIYKQSHHVKYNKALEAYQYFWEALKKAGFTACRPVGQYLTYHLPNSEECKRFIETVDKLQSLGNIKTEVFTSYDFTEIQERYEPKKMAGNFSKYLTKKSDAKFFDMNNNNNIEHKMILTEKSNPYISPEEKEVIVEKKIRLYLLERLNKLMTENAKQIPCDNGDVIIKFDKLDQAKEFQVMLSRYKFKSIQITDQFTNQSENINSNDSQIVLSKKIMNI